MKYRLGLDIGTNSIGWAVIALDATGTEPVNLVDANSRIFTDGREVKSNTTLKSSRTEARSARRRRDRYIQRRTYLLAELRKFGLFPESEEESKQLQLLDPLEVRSNAVNQKIPLYEIGRALFHLNQRRGFKSNRKDPESRSGVVKDSIDKLHQDLAKNNCKTLGELLWRNRKEKLPTRARRQGSKKSDLYDFYPARDMLEDEFQQIWEYQSQFHSSLNEKDKNHFHHIIFWQRDLKPAKVGKCAYLQDEDRAYRAMPSLQLYRILQEVNNLEWSTVNGTHKLIEIPEARDLVLELFQKPSTKDGKIVFTKIQKIIKELGITEGQFKFNLQSDSRKHLDGDKTAAIMQRDECFGERWHQFSLEEQDEITALILNHELNDDQVVASLVNDYDLGTEHAEQVANSNLTDGAGGLSLKAAKVLNEIMQQQYCIQPNAVQKAVHKYSDFHNPYKLATEYELLDELPYYGEAVRGHIIPGKGDEDDEQSRIGMVSNPTVHIALNQIRHIVNEVIKRFGHPHSIAIELARDLPLGEKGRSELNREIAKNTKRNEKAKAELEEHDQAITHDSLLRLKLWKELGDSPTDRRCVFTGDLISIEELFNGRAEIEHLIPYSVSLDDSFMNKTICKRSANRDKGNRTPFQAFGGSGGGYEWAGIFTRAQRLHKNKHWRFEEDALEIWKRDHNDFLTRHLNDTRYIGRLAREYLTNICKPSKIDVITGRLTSLLRHHWGLNTVLDENGNKNRDDHRHHAIDGIVIALTNRSILQKVARSANKSEELALNSIFPNQTDILPWQSFRDDVETLMAKTIVSHKADRHRTGQLHNDTAYGIVDGPDDKGRYQVVVRKPVENISSRKHIESIRDKAIKDRLLEKPLDQIQEFFNENNIRSIRCEETLSVIPIKDSNGNNYKAYKGDGNWAMEIYQMPDVKKTWKDVIVSTFEANQKNPVLANKRKPHPAAKLMMRLHRNDYLQFQTEEEKVVVLKVQGLSKGTICCCHPNESNSDKRNRDKEDEFKYIYKSASSLKKENARKIHISPTGLISG